MGIWNFFSRRRNARVVAQLAAEVTERSCGPVLDRVRRRATTMRIAEARGYVRSRALEIVHRELAAIYKGRIQLDPATQTEIISHATDMVMTRVLAELRSVPKAVRPEHRKAA